jgi:hypothetical protein
VLGISIIGSFVSGIFSTIKKLFGFSQGNSDNAANSETYTEGNGETRPKIIADNEGEYVDFVEVKELFCFYCFIFLILCVFLLQTNKAQKLLVTHNSNL